MVIYFGLVIFITTFHATYSVLSVTASLAPLGLFLLFLAVLWKYTNLKKEQSVRRAILAVAWVCFIPSLYCVIALGIYEYESNFAADRWENSPSDRAYMVDDFLNENELIGQSKENVMNLLGAPDETEYFTEKSEVVYYLGSGRLLIPIDNEYLVIWLDASNKILTYEILVH